MKTAQTFLVLWLLLLSNAFVYADWQFYEITNIKGSVSGTVKQGRTFENRFNGFPPPFSRYTTAWPISAF